MSILKIKLESDPILRRKCAPLKVIDRKTRRLLSDMLDTMYEARGVGLAAPQIGINKRLIVVDVGDEGQGPWMLVNPVIVARGEEEELGSEGCLSCPGLLGDVWRSSEITVRAFDVDGNMVTIQAKGFEARCFQHEIDHLDGRLFIDIAENIRSADAQAEDDDCCCCEEGCEHCGEPCCDGDEIDKKDGQ
ncbi:peptide deformylase [bacterium]|nr:peptide deformylase [bacterium]